MQEGIGANKISISSTIFSSSIFWKVFLSIFIATIVSLSISWLWLYNRVYSALDREARTKLQTVAENIVQITKGKDIDSFYALSNPSAIFADNFSFKNSNGWIQNFYWLDMRNKKPIFVASYSYNVKSKTTMAPPTANDAEDLIFDYINELDNGTTVFPDPYAYGISRRFKIILVPILDEDQVLESVVGVEADMEYLNLMVRFKGYLVDILVFGILITLFISILLANSFSRKIRILLKNIAQVSCGNIPEKENLNVTELTDLNNKISDMARQIKIQHSELQKFYNQKLEELAFTGAAIAHEIRNPLSAIEMHFGLLKRYMNKQGIAEHESVEEIYAQFSHLKILITNFLSYSKKVEPQKEDIKLKSYIDNYLNRKHVVSRDFEYQVVCSEEFEIYFDTIMLEQICDNLVNNSLEAASGHLKITITTDELNGIQKIYFEDNGPGIPDEIMTKLFTPFNTAKKDGNGIGLALVRKFVEAHGGKIYCKNIKNGGALFTIEVPNKNECTCN